MCDAQSHSACSGGRRWCCAVVRWRRCARCSGDCGTARRMRGESAKLWTDFLEQFEGVHVYTGDPGAHAIAVELVPLIAGLDLFAGWFAEGWSARERPECRSAAELTAALDIGTTLILGSQTDFGRTQGLLRTASAAGARTIFVFDHWKNFAEHFAG